MARWFFIFQYLLAAVLCLAASAMRVRSFQTGESFARRSDGLSEPEFQSDSGSFLICRQCCRWGTTSPPRWSHASFKPDGVGNIREGSQGFEFAGSEFWLSADDGVRTRYVVLPWWAIIFACLAVVILTFPLANTRINWRRRRPGLCPACGYDLRSSPAKCPECGRAADTPKERPSRRSLCLAGSATLLVLASTMVLSWWSNPSRGASPGPAKNLGSLGIDPPWENARGTAPQRMSHAVPDWGQSWNQAIWHSPDQSQEDMLVIVGHNIGGMFDEYYQVTLLDRSMHVVREGMVGFPPNGWTPYRLVEIRSNDPSLPPAYRGKWALAIDSLPKADFRKTSPEGEQTYFHRSIVTWGNVGGGIPDTWMYARDLKVQPAEPAPTFSSDDLQTRLPDIVKRTMPELKLEGVGFSDTIDFLRDVMGVNIVVDWTRSAINPIAPVTTDEKNTEFSQILTKVLSQGGDPNDPPAYAAVNEVLVISTADGLKIATDLENSLAATPMSEALRGKLSHRIPSIDFDATGLATALNYLTTMSGLAIEIDSPALKAAGIERDAPLHMHLKNIPVGQALCIVASELNSTKPIRITAQGDKLKVGCEEPENK